MTIPNRPDPDIRRDSRWTGKYVGVFHWIVVRGLKIEKIEREKRRSYEDVRLYRVLELNIVSCANGSNYGTKRTTVITLIKDCPQRPVPETSL